MVGGRPDYHDQYNRAVQAKRQPGSVLNHLYIQQHLIMVTR